ncbi:hypothetical protein HPB51_004305 [Rhipicephalus microplus]|uniref:THAP-type domain-containing protein n=1 Tax=Rhipicephalus microplus TaxID=6941 RepID=A0A9J6ELY9_RHIMP|nr:hypothetical protein HPB51_004305 [Rhipicephalus microplus]
MRINRTTSYRISNAAQLRVLMRALSRGDSEVASPAPCFGFPRSQPHLYQQWVVNLKRDKWKPSPGSRLCSSHFTEACFDRSGSRTRLKSDAIPTLFSFPEHLQKGLFFSVTGVALLDLADVYGTDVGSVAQLVTTRGVGILAGSFFGGLLYDRLNTQLLSVLFTALTSASVFVTPSSGELLYAHGTSVLAGFSMGALDTGANVWLINLWPSGCGPVLQVYHLAFGVGAFIAPFVAEPFLSCNTSVTANTTRHGGLLIGADTLSREPQLPFAFGIVSGFIALVATSMFVVYLVDRSDCKPSGGEQSSQPVNLVLVGLLGCYIMAYLGLECSYGQMLATFAVESDLRMTKSEAAYLTSLYFLTFTVARIGSVLWSMLARPSCILITCQLLTAVIFTLLVVFGDSSATWLWTLSGLAGVSLAAIFAAAVSYTVQFVVMTNRLMSMVTVAASLGTMVPPLFVGLFIEKDPMMFTYVCLATALIMSAFCFAMYLVTRGRPLVTADVSETQGGHVG